MNNNIDKTQLSEIELKIFELRDKGHSYRVISKQLEDEGIEICFERIRKFCNAIYTKLGIEEPQTIRKKPKTKVEGYEKEIYALKEKGLSFKQIQEMLEKNNIKVCTKTLSNMFIDRSAKNPNDYSKAALRISKVISDEEIFDLIEQGTSHTDIVRLIQERGVKTSYNTVKRICDKIYLNKGLDKPISSRKKSKSINIPIDEIIKLRSNGLTYIQIAKFFTKQGTKVSAYTIFDRCKCFEDENNITLPQNRSGRKKMSKVSKLKLHPKNYLRREILKLGEKKKASKEQLQLFAKKISEIYGEEINLELDLENNREHDDR